MEMGNIREMRYEVEKRKEEGQTKKCQVDREATEGRFKIFLENIYWTNSQAQVN